MSSVDLSDTNELSYLSDKWAVLFEWQMNCPIWVTNKLFYLSGKWDSASNLPSPQNLISPLPKIKNPNLPSPWR